jgi:hypothetical protein
MEMDYLILHSPFGDIPSSIWFIIATITTCGYGDMVPLTFWGRFIAFISMNIGILVRHVYFLLYCFPGYSYNVYGILVQTFFYFLL